MGQSPQEKLYNAVRENKLSAIEQFIKQGVDLDVPFSKADDDSQSTALSIAAILDKVDAARLLLEAGADVNAMDIAARKPIKDFLYHLRNPLIYAATHPSSRMVKLLIDHGADLKVRCSWGHGPLYAAVNTYDGKETLRTVEVFLAAGLKSALKPELQGAILHGAIAKGSLYCRGLIALLVAHGADPNQFDKQNGWRPLHSAVASDADMSLAELLECGADPTLTAQQSKDSDCSGLTPLEFARKIKANKKIVSLLEGASGKAKVKGKSPANKAKVNASKPKKLLTAAKAWEAIEAGLASKHKSLAKSLVKGATASQVSKMMGKTKIRLTGEVKEFFQRHNGQTGEEGLILDESSGERFRLLSVDQAIKEWEIWQVLDNSGDFEDAEASPDKGVRDAWWHPKWLPMATNTAGDFLCFDISPAAGGKIGQVITLWHDRPNREIAFASVRDMLTKLAEEYSVT
jgi:cell wall assembly regulator SMI1